MSWIFVTTGIEIIVIIIFAILSKFKIEERIENKTELNNYKREVEDLKEQKKELQESIDSDKELLDDYQDRILKVQKKYREELNKKTEDLNLYFERQKELRQSEMDTDFERLSREKKEKIELQSQKFLQEQQAKEQRQLEAIQTNIDYAKKNEADIINETFMYQQRLQNVLEPLKRYEAESQDLLFYTIQVPEEYKTDISFLLNTVSQKVQHPDIINKLVWAEYVKPYIAETFKRIEIKEAPGIYKLTNIQNKKCYIGKSTNIKKRITDHFKSSIGISTISDQAVHHEILNTGFWNWMIEIIEYCDKDKLNEQEKFYINFFQSQSYGYNKTGGGEG